MKIIVTDSSYTATSTTTAESKTTEIPCPNGWIDAQSHDLGCVNFLNEVSLSWFEAYDVCQEKYSGSLVEALTSEEAEFLFEIAEMIHLYSSNETWWIGLTDFIGRYLTLWSILNFILKNNNISVEEIGRGLIPIVKRT